MNPERWREIKVALDHALGLKGASRQSYIDEITANDLEMRLELLSLVEAHEGSGDSFLNVPAAFVESESDGGLARAGTLIGNYRLVREIGEGGMGQVWLAEQTAPVRRFVALKLIRAGMLDDTVLQRFKAERQSLAMMDHPGIAKVFDAGSTQQGQPYFVMEYVPGLPINQFCDQKRLKVRDRLELFIQACEGVQHAHQKAIIHRDLKPANILIVEVDGKAMARIIDFGVAKAAAPRATDQTLYTQFGQFVGTPGYMSPEQIDPNIRDVDTRTDVYSLGVILYVLLTGMQPFENKRRQSPPLDEWLRRLREEDPPSLVAKISADRETVSSVAEARSTEPKLLRRELRGDLEWITRKALERDRERRYGTPSELSADLRRYLGHEAVEAGPSSAMYRVGKFIRRHRFGIAAAGVLLLTLIGGLAATSYEARVASQQRDAAQQAQLRSLTQTAAGRLRDSDLSGAMGIILEVLPHRGAVRSYTPEALSVFHEARAADAQIMALSGHSNTIWRAAFSRDGRRIGTASWDKTARIWDAATGRQLLALSGHTAQLNTIAFSPDGRRVITGAHDKTARIWDTATGEQIMVLSGHTRYVLSAAYSPDGKRIATVSTDRTARIWDAETGKQIMMLGEQPGRLVMVNFSPDGRRIVTAADDKMARVWDAASGKQIVLLSGHAGRVWCADFSPDGTRVITASEDKTARLWDAATGKEILRFNGHANRVNGAAFSPDGQRIATVSDDKTLRLWDAATGQQLELLTGHTDPIWSVSFSPDGRRLLTASADKTARVWDATDGEIVRFSGHTSWVLFAAYSPDGSRVVTSSHDYTARLWDAANGSQLLQLTGHTDPVNTASFSPDGRRIVTASDDQTARIWDATTGVQLLTMTGNKDRVSFAVYSPDGSHVLTAVFDKFARIYDAATGQLQTQLSGHTDRVIMAAYSPDGKRVVTASNDKTARIWDALTGKQTTLLSGHTNIVGSAEFSPDGTRVVTSSFDASARVWDAATGQQLLLLKGHEGALNSASYSLDGRRIATAGNDKTARIWDAATGREIMLFAGHRAIVSNAAFSPDGNTLVTASNDNSARIWDARAPELADQIDWSQAAQFDPLPSAERFQLGLPAAVDVRQWPAEQSKCDQAAAAPYDPDRKAQGVILEQIVADIALAACTESRNEAGGNGRLQYQRGRALQAGGDLKAAAQAFEQAMASGYRSAAIDLARLDPHRAPALYQQAWRQGVPIAAFALGHVYEEADPAMAWVWYGKGAQAGEPNALARFAERADAAGDAGDDSKKRFVLLEAFGYFAAACERARREDWPDDAWKTWRYRRASLARVLARQGMMVQVADAYAKVIERGSPEAPPLRQRIEAAIRR